MKNILEDVLTRPDIRTPEKIEEVANKKVVMDAWL